MQLPLKLDRSIRRHHALAGGTIDVLYPGMLLGRGDSGIGAIGRVDQARLAPGKTISMHPHRDDEILTYIRGGTMLHRDTVGDEERITATRLMLMNAGHRFQHEEEIMGNVPVEVLQIFLRPSEPGLEPRVQFHAFADAVSAGRWRLIAGLEGAAPLVVRAPAWVHDAHLVTDTTLAIPDIGGSGTLRLLYVFAGDVAVDDITLSAGDGLLFAEGAQSVVARSDSDLVLFTTPPDAPVFTHGMFSGNILAGS